MSFNQSLQHILQFSAALLKAAIFYLNAHPVLHYGVIFVILIAISLLVISAPKKAAPPVVTTTPPLKKINTIASHKDIAAIAGDDVAGTQLDLAKAYIEMDQKSHAKRILNDTLKQGNPAQQAAARQLLETLSP